MPTPDFVEIRNVGTSDLETTPFLSGENDVSTLEESFVVKPAREGSSLGINIVHPSGQISLEDALKKALKNGQTVVWFNKKLIGKPDYLLPLMNSSLKVQSANYINNTTIVHLVISNNSDAPYTLRNQSDYDFYNATNLITVPPHGSTIIDVRTITKKRKFELEFEVLNALIKPDTHPIFRLVVRPKQ